MMLMFKCLRRKVFRNYAFTNSQHWKCCRWWQQAWHNFTHTLPPLALDTNWHWAVVCSSFKYACKALLVYEAPCQWS